LLGQALDLPLAECAYPDRLAVLRSARVGLWDVITTTQRRGSLDSQIRAPIGSDLAGLLNRLPELQVIAFNGGTAARLGIRQLGLLALNYRLLVLPSSSPAYTLPFDDKLVAWREIAVQLNHG
jgi:hypoxanthine-DNA glycosylase